MSTHGEGQVETSEGLNNEQKIPTLSVEEIEQLKKTNERLLEESKRFKLTAKELEAEKERLEKEKAEKSGNLQKIVEMEREKAKKLQDEFVNLKKKTMESNVKSAFSKYASEVQSIDVLLKFNEFAHILEDGKDEENLTVSSDAVDRYVQAVLEKHPYLRKSGEPSTFNKVPQTPVGKKKSLADLSVEEIKELYKRKG